MQRTDGQVLHHLLVWTCCVWREEKKPLQESLVVLKTLLMCSTNTQHKCIIVVKTGEMCFQFHLFVCVCVEPSWSFSRSLTQVNFLLCLQNMSV